VPIINCPDCQKEMSDSAPACPNCGKPNGNVSAQSNQHKQQERSVGILLGIGIFLIPLIFSWFTLRKGHSTLSKVVAFGWLALTFLVVVASDGTNEGKSRSTAASSPASAPKEEIMAVNIRSILSDYENNEVGADNKYKGNLVEVSGIVSSIKKDLMDSLYVTLGTGASFQIPEIQAFFDDSMNDQLGELRKGQRLTVVCRISGLMMNVLAEDCVIK
jgi:putative nucleic acid binding protein